jgi:uncharacterized protein YbjT (DUF2867 family)
MRIAIAGSSGLVGSKLLNALLADSRVSHVIALLRRSLNLPAPRLTEVLVQDLSETRGVAELLKADVYFCCLGTTIKTAGSQEAFRKIDYQAIVDFAGVARDNGARAFVLVSASGASPKSRIFYSRVKGETEEAVKALGFPSLTIARPGLLMGERKEHRAGESFATSLTRGLSKVLPKSLIARGATDVPRLARILLEQGLSARPGVHVLEPAQLV